MAIIKDSRSTGALENGASDEVKTIRLARLDPVHQAPTGPKLPRQALELNLRDLLKIKVNIIRISIKVQLSVNVI